MEDEATARTDRNTAAGNTQDDSADNILVPSFSPSSPTSPTPTGTLTRLGMSLRAQATGIGAPGSPTTERGQVSAITVVALLDKLVNMLESVQENQQRMEQRQAELEGAVRTVQGDVTRLSKAHLSTSNNVNKLLERSRKVGVSVKEVKERLDKQAVQVKRLENNHAHLLKRNHFKVLIFQEDNEIPTDVLVKDSLKTLLPSQYDAESTLAMPSVVGSVAASEAPSVAGSMRSPEEGLHNISLTSDEEDELSVPRELLEENVDTDSTLGMGSSRTYERRADRFKRNSLKKVDSLKKAFSRQSIEKKVNQITTKIVPPEKREKIIKSFTPNHPKSPTAKSSSFKVTPMTFNVKKQVRDGEIPTPEASPSAATAHVEIPPLGSLDCELPTEVQGAAGAVTQIREALNECSVGAEISDNGEVDPEINGDNHSAAEEQSTGEQSVEEKSSEEKTSVVAVEIAGSAGLAVPECVDDVGEDDEEDIPAECAAEANIPVANTNIPTTSIVVEQAS